MQSAGACGFLRGADVLTCWLSEEPPWSRAILQYLYGRRTDDDASKAWLGLDDQLWKTESYNTRDVMIRAATRDFKQGSHFAANLSSRC